MPPRVALAKAGAHVVAVARTQGGLEELDDEIRNDRRQRHAGAAQPHRFRRHRPARRGAARASRQARHSGRQCRRGRPFLAARPYRDETVERRDGDQRHREFPVDPLHGAAAQAIRRRPRGVHHLRRRQQGAGLSRSLRGLEGSARSAGAGLGPRDRDDSRFASICSAPARSAPGCAPRYFPAKTR